MNNYTILEYPKNPYLSSYFNTCRVESEYIADVFDEYKSNIKYMKSNSEYVSFLTDFLYKVFSSSANTDYIFNDTKRPHNKGMINILMKTTDLARNIQLPGSKICPARETTVSAAEIILNMDKFLDMHIRTYTTVFTKSDLSGMYSSHVLVLDIDDFPVWNFSEEDAIKKIFNAYPILRKIKPNYIVDSGNKGFHIYYLFNSDVSMYNDMITTISTILNTILGGDKTKIGIGTTIAIPYTTNKKTNRLRRVLINNSKDGDRYDIHDFLSSIVKECEDYYIIHNHFTNTYERVVSKDYFENEICYINEKDGKLHVPTFHSKSIPYSQYINENLSTSVKKRKKLHRNVSELKRSTVKINKKTLQNINELRLYDLKRYLDENHNDICGYRNIFLFCYAIILKDSGMDKEECLIKVKEINNNFITSLTDGEIKDIVQSVYRHKYTITNKKIAEMLGFSDNLIKTSALCYSDEIKKIHKKNQNASFYAKSKKAIKAKDNKRIKVKKIATLMKLFRTNISTKKMVKILKISIATIYRWIKKYIKKVNIYAQNKASITLNKKTLLQDIVNIARQNFIKKPYILVPE